MKVSASCQAEAKIHNQQDNSSKMFIRKVVSSHQIASRIVSRIVTGWAIGSQ